MKAIVDKMFSSKYLDEFENLVFLDFKLYNLEKGINYLTFYEIYANSLSEAEAFTTEFLYKRMLNTVEQKLNAGNNVTLQDVLADIEKDGLVINYDNTVLINDIDANSIAPFDAAIASNRSNLNKDDIYSGLLQGELTVEQADELLFSEKDISSENNVDDAVATNQSADDEKLLDAFKDGVGNNNDSDSIDIILIKDYINDIQEQTGIKLPKIQIDELKRALRNKKYTKLSARETALHRKEFKLRHKNKLILEWESMTGQVWPRYTENIIAQKTGETNRKEGDYYDAHHIIENCFGGEHEWWNIHPAKFPEQHQSGIHRKKFACKQNI